MIKLVRLDYRLLHGQVVFSWTGHVGAQRIIVVDDDAANDEMKKSALLLSKPAGVRVNIFTVDKAIAKMPKVEQLDEKIMMIFGNTAALLKFCQAYPKIKEINYGAVANKPGSVAFDQSVFLTPEVSGDWRSPWRGFYKGVRKGNLSNYTIRWPAKLRHTLPTARTIARPLRAAAYGHLSK